MNLLEAKETLKNKNINIYSTNAEEISSILNVDLEIASEIINAIKLTNKSDAFEFYESGINKARNKNDNAALIDLNKAIELDPENSLFISERGNVKFFLKDYKGACTDWNKAKHIGNLGAREKEVNELIDKYCNNNSPLIENKTNKKEGCYIATAIYGSYDAKEVIILRKFRDDYLNQNKLGRLFIEFYYFVSPSFVKLTKNIYVLNYIIKVLLDKFIAVIKRMK